VEVERRKGVRTGEGVGREERGWEERCEERVWIEMIEG